MCLYICLKLHEIYFDEQLNSVVYVSSKEMCTAAFSLDIELYTIIAYLIIDICFTRQRKKKTIPRNIFKGKEHIVMCMNNSTKKKNKMKTTTEKYEKNCCILE